MTIIIYDINCNNRFLPRQAVCNDILFGGNMSQALNSIEVFSHIPQELKFELFISTLGSVDIFKRYYGSGGNDCINRPFNDLEQ